MNRIVRVAFFLFIVASMFPGFVYADSGRAEANVPNVLENPVCSAEPSNVDILVAVNPLCPPICNEQGCCLRCRYDFLYGCVCGSQYICE